MKNAIFFKDYLVAAVIIGSTVLSSCSKDDSPEYIVINPTGTSSSNSSDSSDSSYSSNQPEGAISYNLGKSEETTIYNHDCRFSLYLDRNFNFLYYSSYDYSSSKYIDLHFCKIAKVSGLNDLNLTLIPEYGWAETLSCDQGWAYYVRQGESYVAIYVSSVSSDVVQIWYCQFSPTEGFNH